MAKYAITSFDIFYISYDEPQKEEFWADLSNICPWSKRVDGVKGFDAAHRTCATNSDTHFFVTVDGDNKVEPTFFDQMVDIEDFQEDWSWSWDGRNYVNGLIYGNGGLKLWSKPFVNNMKSHEHAEDSKNAVDFCWNNKYKDLKGCWSTTYTNASPFQAFRSGFREGVKMCLNEGHVMTPSNFRTEIYPLNYQRLLVWMSVGDDTENGLWSMYGARLGTVMTLLKNWNYYQIRDYDWFQGFWKEDISKRFQGKQFYCNYSKYNWDRNKLLSDSKLLGNELRKEVNINLADLDDIGSKFFKDTLYCDYMIRIGRN